MSFETFLLTWLKPQEGRDTGARELQCLSNGLLWPVILMFSSCFLVNDCLPLCRNPCLQCIPRLGGRFHIRCLSVGVTDHCQLSCRWCVMLSLVSWTRSQVTDVPWLASSLTPVVFSSTSWVKVRHGFSFSCYSLMLDDVTHCGK